MSLRLYAARNAGGPGAIYVGDLRQLAGPAPSYNLADTDGYVPLHAIEQHRWIFESEYYRSLLQKANLDDPTPLTSVGERITILHACINRALLPCQLIETYLAPNLEDRTDGQLRIRASSFPELGIAGPDTLQLVSNGTLDMANVYSGYILGELPISEVHSLWGLYPDQQTAFESNTKTLPILDSVLTEATSGGVVVNHNWFAGDDQFIFSSHSLRNVTDFRGLKTRTHAAALSDWVNGMGAEAHFVAFAEVYTSLERGFMDAGITGARPGHGQRWYEVVDYLNGPLISFFGTGNVVNADVWSQIPPDLQQILIEEGAKSELEQLRLAPVQNMIGLQNNLDAGIGFIQFSPEIKRHSFNEAAMNHVIPGWLRRLGYPGRGDEAVDLFNAHVGPYVGLRITPGGAVATTPITEGPHTFKTMQQVLAE